MSLRCDLEAADLAKVEARVLEEIQRIQDEGITEDERVLAVTKAESEHAFQNETSEGPRLRLRARRDHVEGRGGAPLPRARSAR